jgi:hypothetical protein
MLSTTALHRFIGEYATELEDFVKTVPKYVL